MTHLEQQDAIQEDAKAGQEPDLQPLPQELDEWGSLKVGALAALAATGLAACGGGAEESAFGQGSGPTLQSASLLPQSVTVTAKEQAATLTVDQPVYRFAKISNGAYFYTGNPAEKDLILASYPDFRYEGIGFNQSDTSTGVPVYRFANLLNGGYFYTANPAERDLVLQTRPDMRYEGTSFSVAQPTQVGAVPVYRLANLNNGAYLYTASAVERDAAIALGYWRNEGIAFYTAASSGTGSLTETDAARFLQQAQFSASDAEIASVRAKGYAVWLNEQFDAAQGIKGWDWLNSRGYDAVNEFTYYNSEYPCDYMIWNQLMSSPDGVRKRAALALSEFFVVGITGVDIAWRSHAMAHYWDTLATNAFGNFRKLLEDITLNAAMGYYLNTKGNQKEDLATGRQPDENYAREVMQLFTIGLYQLNNDGTEKRDASGNKIETYTSDDVSNLARVFTGYDWDQSQNVSTVNPSDNNRPVPNTAFTRLPMVLIANRHSNLAATFLGVTITANTPALTALKTALDTLFNHPNAGPFFGKQMIQRLVTSNPSPAYVSRVAAAFNNNGTGVRGDLRAVFSAVLLDDEARSATGLTQAAFGKLREPILRFVQWGRTFGINSARGSWKIGDLTNPGTALGQSPLRSSSVFNFFRPGYIPPSTVLATTQSPAPEFQIVTETSVSGFLNYIQGVIRNGVFVNAPEAPNNRSNPATNGYDITASYVNELALVTDASALVQRLNILLTAGQLSSDTQNLIINALNATTVTAASSSSAKLDRVAAAVFLVMASAEYLIQK